MIKIIIAGLISGVALLAFSFLGLHMTILFFPDLAVQYFDPAYNTESGRFMFFYIHPFVISLALSWFWSRFKGVLTGSFLTKGVEFGLIYILVAIFPNMWLIYSTMQVSLDMVFTWFVLAFVQSIIAGLIFEKINP